MLIRQEFHTLPPKPYMMQILDRTSKTYVFLWERKDDMNCINMSWEDVGRYHNKNSFKNSLRKLCEEGLLDYKETASDISIELVGWDDDFEE